MPDVKDAGIVKGIEPEFALDIKVPILVDVIKEPFASDSWAL